MKRFARILLLLIFALLQGIAPLAHAHINGSSAGYGVHLPEAQLSISHGTSKIGHSAHVVETQDLGVQGGERLDEYITAHILASSFMLLLATEMTVRPYHSPVHPLTFPTTCAHRPYPHAPPASAIL